jgi:hypothetical protein
LTCLAILIPQYCGSLTNTTCICTSAQLTAALEPFALAACNITEALQLEKYSAVSCGVPNERTRYHEQLAIYYVAPPLAFIFVIARIFMRIKLDVGLGPDDWMMVAALCAYLTDVGTGLGITTSGFGQHTFWLSTAQVTKALKVCAANGLYLWLILTSNSSSILAKCSTCLHLP